MIRILSVLLAGLLVACGTPSQPTTATTTSVLPVVEVHRSPTCDCCGAYEDYLRGKGFTVEEVVRDDVADLKTELGIPQGYGSCHTSLVAGYFVEGHVPADVIIGLVEDGPTIDGITLPGMPSGSPGMPGAQEEPWTIFSITGGETAEYATYEGPAA